jgi:hypothetical protein
VVLAPVDPDLVAPAVPVDHMGRADPVVPAVLRPVARAVLVDPNLAGRAVLGLAAPVDLMDPADLVALTAPAGLDRMAPAVPGGLDLVARAVLGHTDLVIPADLVVRVVLGRVARMVPADRMGPAARDPMDRADPVVLAARVARVGLVLTDPVGPVTRAAPVALGDRVVPANPDTAGLVAPADRHRRRMCSAVSTTVVARSGVARGTHRTASALPITARRRRLGKMGTAGMEDLLPELRRPTGTARLLLGAGTDRRPLAAGILAGMGRHAT